MSDTYTIGLVGYGHIGTDIAARVEDDDDMELGYVYVRSEKDDLPSDIQISAPEEIADHPVDLSVEVATPAVLEELAEPILEQSDLLVLSGSAFADRDAEERLTALTKASDHEMYVSHGCLFGMDGLVDGRESLEEVHLEATKAPSHLDFEYAGEVDPDDIDGRTVVYDGPTRGLCKRFPRNFNSHAAMAMAGLGLDETTSTLVADPEQETALHEITATGPGFELEAVRDSAIEGVTGDYTLVSTWGSMRRILKADAGVQFI